MKTFPLHAQRSYGDHATTGSVLSSRNSLVLPASLVSMLESEAAASQSMAVVAAEAGDGAAKVAALAAVSVLADHEVL